MLDRLPLKQAGQQVPEEQLRLRDALERAQDMITVLKNRLDQKDAAIDVLKLNYEQQVRADCAGVAGSCGGCGLLRRFS